MASLRTCIPNNEDNDKSTRRIRPRMCAEYPMHNIASLSSLPTVSSPSLSVPVHAWISRLCLAIELRPTPSCPIHLHSSSSSFLPSFVRIQAQKPMSENNESMMRTEKRELFRILSRNEKVFNFQCLCTKEWNGTRAGRMWEKSGISRAVVYRLDSDELRARRGERML